MVQPPTDPALERSPTLPAEIGRPMNGNRMDQSITKHGPYTGSTKATAGIEPPLPPPSTRDELLEFFALPRLGGGPGFVCFHRACGDVYRRAINRRWPGPGIRDVPGIATSFSTGADSPVTVTQVSATWSIKTVRGRRPIRDGLWDDRGFWQAGRRNPRAVKTRGQGAADYEAGTLTTQGTCSAVPDVFMGHWRRGGQFITLGNACMDRCSPAAPAKDSGKALGAAVDNARMGTVLRRPDCRFFSNGAAGPGPPNGSGGGRRQMSWKGDGTGTKKGVVARGDEAAKWAAGFNGDS